MTLAEHNNVKSKPHQFDALSREREAIVKSGRLHWFHWMVVALSLVVTFGAWYFTKQQIDEKTKNQFKRASEQVVELVSERMQKYEDGLWGGVSAIQAHGGDMNHAEWRQFSESLRIDVKYPGINGIGVIHQVNPGDLDAYLSVQRQSRPDYRVHPEHDRSEYLPITYIEPSRANAEAVGLDIAHETNRYRAALRSRDTGTAQITGPIVLVQDEGHSPGFLFYAPYYSGGVYSSVQDRRAHFVGMVYAPFVFHKLMEGVLQKEKRQVRIRVSDAEDVLYDELVVEDRETDLNSLFATEETLNLYGRTWTFEIRTTNSFRTATANGQPAIILTGGIVIDCLLFAMFFLLSRSNRRAVSFADRMTGELKAKAESLSESEGRLEVHVAELQRTNIELKRFAFVASHDLQEPLRKLRQCSEFLQNDSDNELSDDSQYYLGVICRSSSRMSKLIGDLLAYSRTANRDLNLVEVDLAEVTASVLSELDFLVTESNATIQIGRLPTVTADSGAVGQLMRNLIGNAIKYRDREREPKIEISSRTSDEDGAMDLLISDNGIGFDMKHSERIFEPFGRLFSKNEYPGSGIGLAVCKTICHRHGWKLVAASTPGEGSIFSVVMPANETWRAEPFGSSL